MSAQPLPSTNDVKDLFIMLLGDNTTVAKADPMSLEAGKKQLTATYIDDARKLQAAVICDLPMGAYAASRLTMIPPAGAQDAVDEGGLSSMMLDNFNEVMNICVTLVTSDTSPHLKLDTVNQDVSSIAEDAKEVIAAPGERIDFDIEVAGYGKGRMAVLLA